MLQTETLSLVRTAPAPDVLEEFEKQVKTYEKAFYHFAYRLTGNHDDAEDLTQEALLKAYRAFHRFKTGTAFDRWVYQIIYRLFIDQYRKKRRRPFVASLDESPPYLDQEKPKEVPDHSKLPEDFALRHELGETIQKALLRLPEEFRAAVVLCDVKAFPMRRSAIFSNVRSERCAPASTGVGGNFANIYTHTLTGKGKKQ